MNARVKMQSASNVEGLVANQLIVRIQLLVIVLIAGSQRKLEDFFLLLVEMMQERWIT
jgi:hypothetical protein